MRKLSYVFVFAMVCALLSSGTSMAQEMDDNGYNPNSVLPIHESDIMWKKRVWRRMDLQEKQNKPFFAYNKEITRLMIDAVKAGILVPYKNDSLTTRMSKEEFLKNLEIPEYGGGDELTEEEKAMGFSNEEPADDAWGGDGWSDEGDDSGSTADDGATADSEKTASASDKLYFSPRDVSVLELQEDMIFDKRRSRLFFDIQSVKMVIPSEKFETGLIRELGVFKYKDLVELFRNMPEEAVWFNPHNSAQHKNLADAFTLRLFGARIIKVANPDDAMIVDIYNRSPREGIMASQWLEQQLIEFEHNLWEF
ncbi:gliding motility protein GldN [Roseivirga sp. BDSF3-8]|uniref:type IX secretion system ring protein PorN/GldN n=1 Tax=Roseivirga sp. BDSF3-8 TaxID=3241598 RepID=UPI003531A50B